MRQSPAGAQIIADDDVLPVAIEQDGSVSWKRRSGLSGGANVARDNIIGTSLASRRGNSVEDVAVTGGRAVGKGTNVGKERGMEKKVGTGRGAGRGQVMAKTRAAGRGGSGSGTTKKAPKMGRILARDGRWTRRHEKVLWWRRTFRMILFRNGQVIS